MIIDTRGKMAVKCSKCGTYSVVDIDLFKLIEPKDFHCKCGHKMLSARVTKGELRLEIDCIACEKRHAYRFKLKRVIKQPMNIICCPSIGMELAMLGRDDHVKDFMKKYRDDMLELLRTLGVISKRDTI